MGNGRCFTVLLVFQAVRGWFGAPDCVKQLFRMPIWKPCTISLIIVSWCYSPENDYKLAENLSFLQKSGRFKLKSTKRVVRLSKARANPQARRAL